MLLLNWVKKKKKKVSLDLLAFYAMLHFHAACCNYDVVEDTNSLKVMASTAMCIEQFCTTMLQGCIMDWKWTIT